MPWNMSRLLSKKIPRRFRRVGCPKLQIFRLFKGIINKPTARTPHATRM
jgi:hypothetical protein